jgi:hypothetical protein
VECIQSLVRSYKRHVQSLFDLYLFNEYTKERHENLLSQIEKLHKRILSECAKLLCQTRKEKIQNTLIKTENHILEYKKEHESIKYYLNDLDLFKIDLKEILKKMFNVEQKIEEGEKEVKDIMKYQKKTKLHLEKLNGQMYSIFKDIKFIYFENSRYVFKNKINPTLISLNLLDEELIKNIYYDLSVNLETLQINHTARKPKSLINEMSIRKLKNKILESQETINNKKEILVDNLRKLDTQFKKQNQKISTLDVDNYSEKFLRMVSQRKVENSKLIAKFKLLISLMTKPQNDEFQFLEELHKLFDLFEKRLLNLLNSKMYMKEMKICNEQMQTISENFIQENFEQKKNNIIDIIAQTSRENTKSYNEKYEFSYIQTHENNEMNSQNFSSSFDPEKLKDLYKSSNMKTEEDFNYSFEQFGNKVLWGTNSAFKKTDNSNIYQENSRPLLINDQIFNQMLLEFDLEMDIEDILKLKPDFFQEINKLYFFESFEKTNDLVIRDMISGLPIRANIKNGNIISQNSFTNSSNLSDFVSVICFCLNLRSCVSEMILPKFPNSSL